MYLKYMHTCVHSLSSDIKKLRVEIDQIGKLVSIQTVKETYQKYHVDDFQKDRAPFFGETHLLSSIPTLKLL